jgi:type IV pilus assembly protein PilE
MRRSKGFSLLEILIVVAIIGILAAIALPSYRKQIQRSNRAAAQSFMSDAANKQQIFLSTARTFAATLGELNMTAPADISPKFYTFKVDVAAGPPPCFTITATAVNTQADDGDLTLDCQGTKTPSAKW